MALYDPENPAHAIQFDSIESLDVAKILEELQAVKNILKDQVTEANRAAKRSTEIRQEIEPLVQRVQVLRHERAAEEEILSDLKPKLKQGRSEIERLEHLLRRAELQRREAEEWDRLSQQLDLDTAWLPWRQYAFQHQIEGAKRLCLAGGRAILGDKRGLGKTLLTLILCDMLKSQKIIVIGPKETLKNFEKEILHWAKHRKIVSLLGMNAAKRDFVLDTMASGGVSQFIVTINLESWRSDKTLPGKISKIKADTVLIDEAHGIKNPASSAFKGVEEIVFSPNLCPACGGSDFYLDKEKGVSGGIKFARCLGDELEDIQCDAVYDLNEKGVSPEICSVKHVIPMTGTPILNRPMELWPMLYLVDPLSFPSAKKFQDMYLNSWGGFRYGGEEELTKKLGLSFLARDRKSAGVTIPPQEIQIHDIEIDPVKYPAQYRAYEEVKEQAMLFSEAGDIQVPITAMITQILRLRQVITYPMGIKVRNKLKEIVFECDIDQSQKLDYAVDLIQELVDEGERVVLFSQFKAPLEELSRRLMRKRVTNQHGQEVNIRPCILNGDTTDYQKDRIRNDFDIKTASAEHFQWDVVLANYRVGGQSINLTAASQMVILDEEWNPGMEDQAFGRIDRLDTPKETTVHILRCDGTIDEWMAALKEKKAQMIAGFETNAATVREFYDALQRGEF